jgi:hypothetical protein
MFWATLWALVPRFGLSGAVQAFVSRGEMHRNVTISAPAWFETRAHIQSRARGHGARHPEGDHAVQHRS